MIGPFDHGGESPDDVPGFRHEEPEDEDVVCAACATTTLPDFYDAKAGRCDDCDAPVEKSPETLDERMQRLYSAAVKRGDLLAAKKMLMFMERVDAITDALDRMEAADVF